MEYAGLGRRVESGEGSGRNRPEAEVGGGCTRREGGSRNWGGSRGRGDGRNKEVSILYLYSNKLIVNLFNLIYSILLARTVKGIVSPDWKVLQMVSLDRFEV
jgi:hypothetical protein